MDEVMDHCRPLKDYEQRRQNFTLYLMIFLTISFWGRVDGTYIFQIEIKQKCSAKTIITRPSILCVTQNRVFMPLYIVLGQHRACMPVYIGKSGDLVGCYRCLTDTQTTEYRATQLLSSIQFKLSHAISSQI